MPEVVARFLRHKTASAQQAVVMFQALDSEAEALDLKLGPFAERYGPRGGRLGPLASLLDQYPDSLEHIEALFGLLVPHRDFWISVRLDEVASLRQCHPDVVTALADLSESVQRAARVDADSAVSLMDAVAQRWFTAAEWPVSQQAGGLFSRLVAFTWTARKARERGRGVYCWFGPYRSPYVIVSGHTMEEYETYRRAKRRREAVTDTESRSTRRRATRRGRASRSS
jgi:hypothetical protein